MAPPHCRNWEAIAPNGRKIVICFDSDAGQNDGVHRSTERLGRWFEKRGATMGFVYLPHAEDGSKLGVDDFLASGHSRDDLVNRIESEWRPLPSDARRRRPKSAEWVKAARTLARLLNAQDPTTRWTVAVIKPPAGK